MSQVFDPVVLVWDGREFEIPARRVMGAIHRVERHITFNEMQDYAERETAPLGILASAYASVLRYAGCKVTDEQVYEGMFEDGESVMMVINAVNNLLMMMLPAKARNRAMKALEEGEEEKTEAETGNSEGATLDSSKKHSKPSSKPAQTGPKRSGPTPPTKSGS